MKLLDDHAKDAASAREQAEKEIEQLEAEDDATIKE